MLVCTKSFCDKPQLITHSYTHTGQKPFKCDICSKSFSQLSQVTAHSYTHSGERPFKCDICSKSFSQLSEVTAHSYLHTVERPLILLKNHFLINQIWLNIHILTLLRNHLNVMFVQNHFIRSLIWLHIHTLTVVRNHFIVIFKITLSEVSFDHTFIFTLVTNHLNVIIV